STEVKDFNHSDRIAPNDNSIGLSLQPFCQFSSLTIPGHPALHSSRDSRRGGPHSKQVFGHDNRSPPALSDGRSQRPRSWRSSRIPSHHNTGNWCKAPPSNFHGYVSESSRSSRSR